MTAITDLEKEIAEKTAKLEQLKKAEAELESLGPEYKLAIKLHDSHCKWNHTDGCSWHYEIKNGVHDWFGHAHNEWLKKARLFMSELKAENISEEVAFKVIKISSRL